MLNGGAGLGLGGGTNPISGDLDPAILQRSISAPPAPDHERGGFTGGDDRTSLDYYYYYYQPNSINPRLPKNVPPPPGVPPPSNQGGGGASGPMGGSSQDDSALYSQFTHFPQPSKPSSSSTIVEDFMGGLDGKDHPLLDVMAGAGSSIVRPTSTPLTSSLSNTEMPPRPNPIGTSLTDGQKTKSLIELIQEDFPRTPSPVYHNGASISAHAANVAALNLGLTGSTPPPTVSRSLGPSPAPLPAGLRKVPSQQGPPLIPGGGPTNLDVLSSSMQGLALGNAAADDINLLGGGTGTSSATHSAHSIPELAGPGPTHGHGHTTHSLAGMGGMRPTDLEGPGLPRQQRAMYSVEPQQEFQNPPQSYHVLPAQGGGGAPMYAVDPVFIRVAPGGSGYRQDLVYNRVPTEYVAPNGDMSRLQPEYVSVIPMPTAGGGQNYVAAYGGPRIITAPQFRGDMGVGGPGVRIAYPPGYGTPLATTELPYSHSRLQQEAHERGYKLVKDVGRDDRKDRRHHRDRDRDRMGTSSTLDEFRNNTKNRPWDIRDISGDIVDFCQDQHGSRFIQQKLEVATDEEKELIFKEILPRAHMLMTDVFGNYVIQKVLEHGSLDQRDIIASILSGHAVQLALQMYGCRVIQKALEVISVQRLLTLVSEFEGHVLKCVHDQNGNHVIQKCIEVLSLKAKEYPEYGAYLLPQIEFIVQAFVGQVEKFSTHPYGCRVIQRILEHCTGAQKNVILDEIRKCTGTLVQDQYGNYVIQHVMKHGRPLDRNMVINEVKTRMLVYSQHKFASNVVEKCLQYGSKTERNEIIEEVVRSVMEKSSLLQVMVRDPYGNYVVQKILDIADDRQQEALCNYLKHHAAQLKRYTYGKHILVRLEKISGEKLL